MTSILVLWVCLSPTNCHAQIGQEMLWTECMTTGIVKAADFINKHPSYKLKKFACVEPRRLGAVMGERQA